MIEFWCLGLILFVLCHWDEVSPKLQPRKDIFTMWVTGHWHRLPREALESSSLEKLLKSHLDRLLYNVPIMFPAGAGKLDEVIIESYDCLG